MFKKLLPEFMGSAFFVAVMLLVMWPINKVCGVSNPWYYYVMLFVVYVFLFVVVIVWNFIRKTSKPKAHGGNN